MKGTVHTLLLSTELHVLSIANTCICYFRIDFYDERSRLPSDEEAEVTVTDIAIKILELNKPVLEFGHEPCEQVGIV